MSTHIKALKNEIAKSVIMPGDPLRAKYIAETYLEDYHLISSIRNNYLYTGTYKGKKVSVMSSGMGMPSMAIYAYELFNEYGVKNIIRVGSCGAYQEYINVNDIVVPLRADTFSNFASSYDYKESRIAFPSEKLNKSIIKCLEHNNITYHKGSIKTTDVFYEKPSLNNKNYIGVEMECFALFYIAKSLKKDASAILTVSDSFVTKENLSSEEREKGFNKAIKVALEAIL